jgi:hypothetical protein
MNGGGRRTPAVSNAPELPSTPDVPKGTKKAGKRMRASIVSHMVAVIGVFVFFVPAAQAGSGGGGTPAGLPGVTVPMSCRVVDGEDIQAGVTVNDEFGTRQVLIRGGRLLCTSVISATLIQPIPPQLPLGILGFSAGVDPNALRCYAVTPISGGGNLNAPNASPNDVKLFDGLHYEGTTFTEQDVQVGSLQFLCLPAIAQP